MHKIKVGAAVVALLLLSILAINIAAASTAVPKAVNSTNINPKTALTAVTPNNVSPPANINVQPKLQTSNAATVQPTLTDNPDQLKANIPKTYDEAQASILPVKTRFLMYTDNGIHIMWGFFGNGRFVGTDNNGMRCWGIYGNGIFAGFYNGEFFWGHYSNGQWKAEYLFGLRYSHGNYVLFPPILPTTTSTPP